jgi:hypothetical protein
MEHYNICMMHLRTWWQRRQSRAMETRPYTNDDGGSDNGIVVLTKIKGTTRTDFEPRQRTFAYFFLHLISSLIIICVVFPSMPDSKY